VYTRFTPVHAPETTLRVLLVEDSASDAELVSAYLADPDALAPAIDVRRVDRLSAALDALAAEPVDVVLLDLSLPDADHLEGVLRIVAAAPDVPIVVMTGLADDRLAGAAVQAGAQDYLVKGIDGPRELRRAVRYAVGRQQLLARERAARAAAERSTRLRDEVMAIVSHDLRTPLSAIVLHARAQADRGGEHVDGAGVIVQAAEWSLRIIRDLLDVTAIEAGRLAVHPEPMVLGAITEAVETMFASAAREKGVSFVVEPPRPGVWVEVDVDRMTQALGNLVSNAIRVTPAGGRVTLSTDARDDAHASFTVADTGPGIAAEDVPRLFDRFWQARTTTRGAAGLGLAIVQGIVEAHGGRVVVASTPGQGSAFTVTLPRTP
jgi:signal transduction histidine kinase